MLRMAQGGLDFSAVQHLLNEIDELDIPNLDLNDGAVSKIQDTLKFIQQKDQKGKIKTDEEQEDVYAAFKHKYNLDEVKRTNQILKEEFQNNVKSEGYQKMFQERQLLPAWETREVILSAVARHKVIIVSGMTGCGKTTQVPQYILDDALQSDNFNANIICTQPRRISATSIAERVAAERNDTLGKLVGYQIRLDADVSQFTRLLFCTTGIVLRRLEGDPDLEGVTHIIIDEVHERSELSDFLILVVKKLLVRRPELRVILMSATINAKLFSEYFDNCPVINIPGQTFLIRQFFLEDVIEKTKYVIQDRKEYSKKNYKYIDPPLDKTPDWLVTERELFTRYSKYSSSTINTLATMDMEYINYELVIHLLKWIIAGQHEEFPNDGAILVFLPGYGEIEKTYNDLIECAEISCNKDKYVIIPLHSSFSSDEQKAVFHRPNQGIRKIVLSTNIAETSITIDDIVYVVDVGWMKEMRYDPSRKMQSLDLILVSRTNAEQRKGRGGRVQEGVCFHLFTSHTFYNVLDAHPTPEIQRNSLEQVVIRTKILSIFRNQDVELVLQDLINAPKTDRIHDAVELLKDLGALDNNGELTALGYHIGSLPVDVRIGKLMLYGAIFRCLDATLTIAAILSYKSPFISPFKKAKEATAKKKELAIYQSDILTMLRAYQDWWKAKPKDYIFCREFFLSRRNLEMLTTLKQQYVENLSDIGFVRKGIKLKDVQASATRNSDGVVRVTGHVVNANNENLELLSAMLVAVLYPNIMLYGVSLDPDVFKTRMGDYVNMHPSSINYITFFAKGSFLVYLQKVKTKKVYVRECSLVSHLSLLMFGGGSIEVTEKHADGSIEVTENHADGSIDVTEKHANSTTEYTDKHADGRIEVTDKQADSSTEVNEKCHGVIIGIDTMVKYKTALETASALESLRRELEKLLSEKITDPDLDLTSSPWSSAIITCIVNLITDNVSPDRSFLFTL